jgi:hypothetical protein
LRVAEASADDSVLGSIKYVPGSALVCQGDAADQHRRSQMLPESRDMCQQLRFERSEQAMIELLLACGQVRISLACWLMLCATAAPTMTWPKPRPRVIGWQRYFSWAEAPGFEGHMRWAAQMD